MMNNALNRFDDLRQNDRDLWIDEREAFLADGVVLIKNVLSNDEIELLRRAVDDQFAKRKQSHSGYDLQQMAEQFFLRKEEINSASATRFDLRRLHLAVANDPEAKPLFEEDPDQFEGDRSFLYEAAGWRQYPEIRRVAFDSCLPEICAALTRAAYVNFWEDTTFVKTPGATLRTPFHQDATYFQIVGQKSCVAWIPLDPATEENGALEYVIGSHRWNKEFAPNAFMSQTPLPDSPYERLPDIEHRRNEFNIRTIEAAPGDVIVHDLRTIHGARGNCTRDQLRRAISFRYCGDDVRYFNKPGALKQPWIQTPPVNDTPLYTANYPRVWPRPFPGALISKLYD